MIRKIFIGISFALMFVAIVIGGREMSRYSIDAKVIESNDPTATAFEDYTGNIWTIDKDNYIVGENVRLIFNCNHTESDRTDDIIINVERG